MYKLSLAGLLHHCNTCKRTTWHHRTMKKKVICRGDISPSMLKTAKNSFDNLPHGVFRGCAREKVTNGSDASGN